MSAYLLLLLLAAGPDDDDELPPVATSTAQQIAAQAAPRPALNLFNVLRPADLEVELHARRAAPLPFPQFLELVSRGLVSAPYLLSPLGERRMPDPDPRIRWDAFDCTTFVETVMALAACDELSDLEATLDQIRYEGGEVSFSARRHLMTAQWIPQQIAAGRLVDITNKVGGDKAKHLAFEMSHKRWKKRRIAKGLEIPESRIPEAKHSLPIIPIEDMVDLVRKVPPGTILNVVRVDVPWSPVVITHQGIVFTPRGERIRIVRHASPVAKRVVDETLAHMMKRYLKPRKWPIAGVNLLRIRDPRRPAG